MRTLTRWLLNFVILRPNVTKYGSPPAPDEQEITLFGPGYGEAIAIHLGEGHWILVDSCIDPEENEPASQVYLKHCAVNPQQVRAIVASHWHDDHVKGISRLAASYPQAEFFLSDVLNTRESCAYLAAYSGLHTAGLTKGTKELHSVLTARGPGATITTLQRTLVSELSIGGRPVVVRAFSPTPQARAHSVAEFAQYLPTEEKEQFRDAVDLKPNVGAVVLHVDFGDDAMLLGADMEEFKNMGWSSIVNSSWCNKKTRASVYKVAHHGSETGHNDAVWSVLLKDKDKVTSCLTPFNRGSHRLPTEQDQARIRRLSGQAFISSGASKRPQMNSEEHKRLQDIGTNISVLNAGFGAVRIRRKVGASSWEHELFGDAKPL